MTKYAAILQSLAKYNIEWNNGSAQIFTTISNKPRTKTQISIPSVPQVPSPSLLTIRVWQVT